MSDNIRIRTTPGGGEKSVNLKIDQKFDFIEILSLKISQDEAYRRFCSDYGVVVGRVIVNNGLGVPNTKVSIFIPIDEEDKLDPEIFGLYPYEIVTDKDKDGIPYNLLQRNGRGKDECFTPVGTFPNKRQVQDNPEMGEIFCKYYKFTTTTNQSGDFMIFGVPVGTHYMHVEADLSDIGYLSQKPYDLIKEGVSEFKFESNTKFKGRDEDPKPTQIKTISPISVTVLPFWGDTEECEIGITRTDVDLNTRIVPNALFIGSIFTDNDKNSVNKKCRPRKNLGNMSDVVTGEGRIEMLRKTPNGNVERYDFQGGELIDEDGTWAYQVPMNLEYKVTAEDGTLVPSNDPTKGVPTKGKYRFRISMSETGGEGRLRTRAKYLVPHNPVNYNDSDYSFDNTTRNKHFAEMSWNKIYTVKNLLPRLQPNKSVENRNFIGIKDVDEGSNNPFPFNRLDTKLNPLFTVLCIILKVIATLIVLINSILIPLLNIIVALLNVILRLICVTILALATLVCVIRVTISKLPFIKSISFKSCMQGFCIGCVNSNGNCSCKAIIPYIPYITLECGNEKYAPGGIKNPFPYTKTWEATQKFTGVSNDEPSEKNSCPSPPPNGSALQFHYPDDGDPGHKFFDTIPPGDAGWSNCVAIQLAEQLNVFKFDFYNDWINGTLYSFLLKYKLKVKKSGNKEKYCDFNCEKSGSDNNCKTNYIVDSGTIGWPQFVADTTPNPIGVNSRRHVKTKEGYIKKFGDEFYYAAYSRTSNMKLWATDIVSLGSMSDCDWEGIPKVYDSFVDTTFNKPPLTSEYEETVYNASTGKWEESGVIEVSGFDTDGFINPGSLIASVTCIGIITNKDNTTNIRRLCELGVGLDELREDNSGSILTVDDKITNTDVDNAFIRGTFAYVNGLTPVVTPGNPTVVPNSIPFVYFDKAPTITSIFPTSNSVLQDKNYENFRGPITNNDVWQYENSFYFYFGLIPGKTALQKMKRKYFVPCITEQEVDFTCIVKELVNDDDDPNNGTGKITIEMLGGVPPYTYKWTGPTVTISGNIVQYPLVDDQPTIDNLFGGVYSVKVLDSIGNESNCSFTVPGPQGVTCFIDSQPASQQGSNDGVITINASQGLPDYIYEIFDSNNILITSGTFQSSVTVTGDNTKPLIAGEYTIVVKDSGDVQTQCQSSVIIKEPDLPIITLNTTDITCFGADDGIASLNVTGGVQGTNPAPKIEWKDSAGNLVLGSYGTDSGGVYQSFNLINDFSQGTYDVIYTDAAGQTVSQSFTINEPSQIQISTQNKKNISCYGGNDGYLEYKVIGGTGNYEVTINGAAPNNTLLNDSPLPSGSGWQVLNNLYSSSLNDGGGNLKIKVKDENDCEEEIEVEILGPYSALIGGRINEIKPLKVEWYDDPIQGCIPDYLNSPCQNLKIEVKDFDGGWGDTYASRNSFNTGTGTRYGRYKFEIWTRKGGGTWDRTNLTFNQPNLDIKNPFTGWPSVSYTFPSTYNVIDSNGNVISTLNNVLDWDREYKVKVISYEFNDPSVKCEKWVNGSILVESYNSVIPTFCLPPATCKAVSKKI
jgi:hypothetical protein